MSRHTTKLVNMTSTEVFKTQASNIYERLRHLNGSSSSEFRPTHLGGAFGQREVLEDKNVMRETRILDE